MTAENPEINLVDEAGRDSFPASDPPSWSPGSAAPSRSRARKGLTEAVLELESAALSAIAPGCYVSWNDAVHDRLVEVRSVLDAEKTDFDATMATLGKEDEAQRSRLEELRETRGELAGRIDRLVDDVVAGLDAGGRGEVATGPARAIDGEPLRIKALHWTIECRALVASADSLICESVLRDCGVVD